MAIKATSGRFHRQQSFHQNFKGTWSTVQIWVLPSKFDGFCRWYICWIFLPQRFWPVGMTAVRPHDTMAFNEFLIWMRRVRCLELGKSWQSYQKAQTTNTIQHQKLDGDRLASFMTWESDVILTSHSGEAGGCRNVWQLWSTLEILNVGIYHCYITVRR